MQKRSIYAILLTAVVLTQGLTGCQKGDLLSNPNAASESTVVPVSLLLNHITWSMYKGGGVVDAQDGYATESPWDVVMRYNQFYTSNYSYYQGTNTYNWSNSATEYDILKYVVKMEEQAKTQYNNTTNFYSSIAKFFRAYQFIWLARRVGDIPMSAAGDASNLTPSYDTQKEVYANSLALLDSANTALGNLVTSSNSGTVVDASGDIFGLTYLQWQKVVNTYRLRVLIDLSKRATDNSDLNVASQFAAIIGNPTKYPIMTSNADNMVFKYTTVTPYPTAGSQYNFYANICKTYLDLTTANSDPRTYAVATPAPAQLTGGKTISDFTAYVGADPTLGLSDLLTNSTNGLYSFANYNRYYTSTSGANAEPVIQIGYPEMCFNIAEAANRGWITSVTASDWYTAGINASLNLYGITDGKVLTIADKAGTSYGTVTVSLSSFLTNANVAYKGDNSDGLTQILQQKYVAFFQNSGWEAFYNWRRTGVPSFAQGAGTGTANSLIPRRWEYPSGEINYNSKNYQSAIQSQYGGTDDVSVDTWLTK